VAEKELYWHKLRRQLAMVVRGTGRWRRGE
jgi:hypothetical protein